MDTNENATPKFVDKQTDEEDTVWMKDRRPLPPEKERSTGHKCSYFSDKILNILRRENTMEELQNSSLGEYAGSECKYIRYISFREDFGGLYSADFSSDGATLLLGLGNGEVQLLEKENYCTNQMAGKSLGGHPITCVKFHPTIPELFYAASTSGTVTMSNIKGEVKMKIVSDTRNEVNTLDVDHHGMRLITAGKDACIRVYQPLKDKVIHTYGDITSIFSTNHHTPNMHRMRIYCVKFHPVEHAVFVSGGWDRMVKVWDARTAFGIVRTIEGPFISGDAIDMKDRMILTGSSMDKNNLQLWDLGSGLLVQNIVPDNRLVSSGGDQLYTAKFFSGEGFGDLIICAGAGYGALKIISLKENKIVGLIHEKRTIVASTIFQNEIFTGGMSGTCHLVKFIKGDGKEDEDAPTAETEEQEEYMSRYTFKNVDEQSQTSVE